MTATSCSSNIHDVLAAATIVATVSATIALVLIHLVEYTDYSE